MFEITVDNLVKVNPSYLDGNSSVYDHETHTPYPTLSYLIRETGIDFLTICGNEALARGRIRLITNIAKHYLMAQKHSETQLILEFLIAKNKKFRNAFLAYTTSVITTVIDSGLTEFLRESKSLKISDRSNVLLKSFIEGSILRVVRFGINFNKDLVHVGY